MRETQRWYEVYESAVTRNGHALCWSWPYSAVLPLERTGRVEHRWWRFAATLCWVLTGRPQTGRPR